jgi:hypothetical protein
MMMPLPIELRNAAQERKQFVLEQGSGCGGQWDYTQTMAE